MKQNANGEWEVDAIPGPETQHIAAMVARQKPAKKHSTKNNVRFLLLYILKYKFMTMHEIDFWALFQSTLIWMNTLMPKLKYPLPPFLFIFLYIFFVY